MTGWMRKTLECRWMIKDLDEQVNGESHLFHDGCKSPLWMSLMASSLLRTCSQLIIQTGVLSFCVWPCDARQDHVDVIHFIQNLTKAPFKGYFLICFCGVEWGKSPPSVVVPRLAVGRQRSPRQDTRLDNELELKGKRLELEPMCCCVWMLQSPSGEGRLLYSECVELCVCAADFLRWTLSSPDALLSLLKRGRIKWFATYSLTHAVCVHMHTCICKFCMYPYKHKYIFTTSVSI